MAIHPQQETAAKPRPRRRPRLPRGPVLGVLTSLLLLIAWELVVRLHLVSPFFLTPPTMIVTKGFALFATGKIWPNLEVTMIEYWIGTALVLVISIPVGVALGYWKTLQDAFRPSIMALYAVPLTAILPLIMLWFGVDTLGKVIFVFMGGFFPIVINLQAGIQETDSTLLEVADCFMASETQKLRRVVFPSVIPYLLAGLEISVGRMLIMVVVAEMLAASQGLGFMAMQAGSDFDTPVLFVVVVILAIIGVILTSLVRWLKLRLAPWSAASG